MKKVYLLLFLITSLTFGQTPVLTSIVDGTCSGGLPKMIEIYAQGTVDFTQFTLEKQNNGNGFTASLDLSPLGTITDDYVYLYNNGTAEADFLTEFPSASGKTLLADAFISGNGDDAFRIVDSSSNVIDIYGVDGEDGTGMPWEYKDSYAKRNTGAPASASFDATQWTFGGPDFLDNKGTCNGGNAFETEMGGIQTYYQAPAPATSYFSESFENAGNFPAGWTLSNGTDDWAIDQGDIHGPGSVQDGDYCAYFNDYDYSSGTTADMISPAIDLSNATSPELTFWYWDGGGSDTVEVLASTDGTNYTSVFTTPSTVSDWTQFTVYLNAYAGESSVTIAFRGTSIYGTSNPHVDNIVVDEAPSCIVPTDLAVTDNTDTTADLSWTDNNGGSSSYLVEWREVGATTWNSATTAAGATTYQVTGLTIHTRYEWQLTADCGGGDNSDAVAGPEIYTWYCESIPTSFDGNGITNVEIGSETYQAASESYHDFTNDAVADLPQGETANVQITFETGYTYNTNIWIDFNDNLVFDDTELVFQGESDNANPTTLDASFVMDINAPLGNHVMRIGTADSGQATPDPCYSGSYGVTLDFKINVTPAPSCLTPSNLAVSNVSMDSADVSWTDNNSGNASYIVEWREVGATTWNSDTTAAGATSYQITGLTSATEYEWQVTADCGGGTTSGVVPGDNFTTLCDVMSVPWAESFEDPFNFECWQNTGTSSYVWEVNDGSSHGPNSVTDGTQAIMFDVYSAPRGETATATTPVFDMTTLTNPELSFDFWMNGGADTDLWLKVEMSTDNGVTWSEIFNQEQDGTIADWTSVALPLTGTTATTSFRFTASSDYGLYNIFVDNVMVDESSAVETLEQFNFKLYPNPVENNLNISANSNIRQIQIFDLLGQEVLNMEINKAQYSIDTHQLRPGTYVIKIDINNNSGYYRFIKQ